MRRYVAKSYARIVSHIHLAKMYLYPIVDYVNMFKIELKAKAALCSINQGNKIDLPRKNKIVSEWFNIHYYQPSIYE